MTYPNAAEAPADDEAPEFDENFTITDLEAPEWDVQEQHQGIVEDDDDYR